ncbi:hypothetical protein EYZ11_011623 [Aspergillus tanneri]|uniref:Uncharacterized protein n=1 Tax=Aspergillus tanneri TaxID=1220188 RepID=A0A4S3J2Y1_9EURO|nr:hypothetical protein EYZ11_011623 [Aspergillus tanneri]
MPSLGQSASRGLIILMPSPDPRDDQVQATVPRDCQDFWQRQAWPTGWPAANHTPRAKNVANYALKRDVLPDPSVFMRHIA